MSSRAMKALRLSNRRSPDSHRHNRTSSSSMKNEENRGDGDASDTTDANDLFTTTGVQFLDSDPRPTFVVDPRVAFEPDIQPQFCNAALRSNVPLMKALSIKTNLHSPHHSPKASTADFHAWLKYISQSEDIESESPLSYPFWGFKWIAFNFRDLLVVSGSRSNRELKEVAHRNQSPKTSSAKPVSRSDSPNDVRDQEASRTPYMTEVKSLFASGTRDWTLPQPLEDLPPHIIFARSIDWSATPLGDMKTWSSEFRQVANLLMCSPFPTAVFWGEELTLLYNEAYAKSVAGIKHPALMGTGAEGPYKEIWGFVGPILTECQRTGKSVSVVDQLLPIMRQGFEEETYYTWAMTPLYGGTDKVLGLYNTPFETTRQKINERRTKTLLKLGESVALAKSVASFWVKVLEAIEDNEFDFPFALLYSVQDDNESDEGASISSESSQSMKSCVLEGSLGVPEGHPSAPTRLDLKRARGGFIPSFREAMTTREPKLLDITDGTLSESLMEGFEWRGWKEPCRHAVVCPVRPTTGENVVAFLVVGINPRLMYDEDYQAFISLLNRQLATSIASVTLFEEEIRRGLTTENERSRLSDELAIQRSRLHRIAEVSLVGMFSVSNAGLILDCNDRYYEITGHPRDAMYEMSWMEVFKEDSVAKMEEGWQSLLQGHSFSAELELKKPWYDPANGEKVDNWILADCQPEFDEDGKVRTIVGSCTDISPQKRSAKDADARARLSERK
jgi:PAS domain S-box-containing protein